MVCTTQVIKPYIGIGNNNECTRMSVELLLLMQSFYDKSVVRRFFGKSKSLIDGILRNNTNSFFLFKSSAKEKVNCYLTLIEEVEIRINKLITGLMECKESLSQQECRALNDARNQLLLELGAHREDMLNSRGGRELSASMTELIEDIKKLLLPSQRAITVTLTISR